MVESEMALDWRGVRPAALPDGRLAALHGALRDEMLRRGLAP